MNLTKYIAAAALAGSVLSSSAIAEEAGNSAHVYLGGTFQSAYIASGTTVNDGWVFMPYLEVSDFVFAGKSIPLTLGFWGNMDLDEKFPGDDSYAAGRFSEVDLNATFDLASVFGLEDVIFSAGWLCYVYPQNGAESDQLIDAKLGCKKCPLTPTFRAKYRFSGPSKDKCEIGFMIGHTFDLENNLWLNLGADVWYIIQAPGSADDDGFACADFTAKLGYGSVYAFGTYVSQIDDKVLPDGGKTGLGYNWGYDVEWIAGVGFDLAF